MNKLALIVSLAMFAATAEAQVVVDRPPTVPDGPPSRVAADRWANLRKPRRLRNRYYAARPVYPPAERGAAARINFEPYTSKYYPREDATYAPIAPRIQPR